MDFSLCRVDPAHGRFFGHLCQTQVLEIGAQRTLGIAVLCGHTHPISLTRDNNNNNNHNYDHDHYDHTHHDNNQHTRSNLRSTAHTPPDVMRCCATTIPKHRNDLHLRSHAFSCHVSHSARHRFPKALSAGSSDRPAALGHHMTESVRSFSFQHDLFPMCLTSFHISHDLLRTQLLPIRLVSHPCFLLP